MASTKKEWFPLKAGFHYKERLPVKELVFTKSSVFYQKKRLPLNEGFPLKAYWHISKKWCFEKYVHVIKHAYFQLYIVHTDGVIQKTWKLATNL